MAKAKTTVSLDWLLREAQSQWRERKAVNETYSFHLGKFPSGWCFGVIDSWHNWTDKRLKYNFGNYKTPHEAVQAFLDYVAENQIDVSALQER